MKHPRKQSPEEWAKQLNFKSLEREHGLPQGVLTNLVRQESQGNCDAGSSAGAQGLCQFMPATAKAMGVDPSDPVSSINGAAKYLANLTDMFGGDTDKAIAAYNWGPGNIGKAIRKHGENWKEHLPKETKHYLKVVGGGIDGDTQHAKADEDISLAAISDEEERKNRKKFIDENRYAIRETTSLNDKQIDGMDVMGQLFATLMIAVMSKVLDPQPLATAPSTAIAQLHPSHVPEAPLTPNAPHAPARAGHTHT